ncbi:LytTR family DNA-binding domain-containing protein [uncultured Winogradskyella sp.]|uniref:LytR/AlgR family response regulator transcription factor n=1 Tax=uncultured Winogradskyella sp. TaxID=395353 RepID=UPI002627E944|nr:LytTR family DNA-binding domain-containing protein [uncultured Winogradskyella sp.]
MITYLIVDDESMAHNIIKGYCDKVGGMQLMKDCYDALEALKYLRSNTIDLIFLDINMPKLKGFEFLKTLTSSPKVIVTTAYQEYALEGYELNVVDYLLKPFSFERFLKALNKVNQSEAPVVSNEQPATERLDQIFLYADKKHFQVSVKDILFIEASGNYCKVVLKEDSHLVRTKISDFLQLLPSQKFLQVHKSFIVSKQHIDSIEGNRINMLDHKIPIGKLYKANVNEILG